MLGGKCPTLSSYNHLDVSQRDDATIVRFKASHFLLVDEWVVLDIGSELINLVGGQDSCKLIVDFFGVEDLSSLMLGQLVKLRTKMAAKKGQLILCGLTLEVREFLDETMLSQLFDIRETEADALTALATVPRRSV